MPCRCDYDEVISPSAHAKLEEKFEHQETQLCNARSLIHKMLKLIETGGAMPPDLMARAKEHVALLAKHKRAEHDADKAAAKSKLMFVEDNIKRLKDKLAAEELRLPDLKAAVTDPTDEELLG